MTKSKANANDKNQGDRINSPKPVYNAGEESPTSHRKRKLMPPAKPSRISKKAIIKAVEKVIAQRHAH